MNYVISWEDGSDLGSNPSPARFPDRSVSTEGARRLLDPDHETWLVPTRGTNSRQLHPHGVDHRLQKELPQLSNHQADRLVGVTMLSRGNSGLSKCRDVLGDQSREHFENASAMPGWIQGCTTQVADHRRSIGEHLGDSLIPRRRHVARSGVQRDLIDRVDEQVNSVLVNHLTQPVLGLEVVHHEPHSHAAAWAMARIEVASSPKSA